MYKWYKNVFIVLLVIPYNYTSAMLSEWERPHYSCGQEATCHVMCLLYSYIICAYDLPYSLVVVSCGDVHTESR